MCEQEGLRLQRERKLLELLEKKRRAEETAQQRAEMEDSLMKRSGEAGCCTSFGGFLCFSGTAHACLEWVDLGSSSPLMNACKFHDRPLLSSHDAGGTLMCRRVAVATLREALLQRDDLSRVDVERILAATVDGSSDAVLCDLTRDFGMTQNSSVPPPPISVHD